MTTQFGVLFKGEIFPDENQAINYAAISAQEFAPGAEIYIIEGVVIKRFESVISLEEV